MMKEAIDYNVYVLMEFFFVRVLRRREIIEDGIQQLLEMILEHIQYRIRSCIEGVCCLRRNTSSETCEEDKGGKLNTFMCPACLLNALLLNTGDKSSRKRRKKRRYVRYDMHYHLGYIVHVENGRIGV